MASWPRASPSSEGLTRLWVYTRYPAPSSRAVTPSSRARFKKTPPDSTTGSRWGLRARHWSRAIRQTACWNPAARAAGLTPAAF